LNNQWVIEEISKEIKKFLDSNDNEDTTYQNLWHAGKEVSRRKFIAMSAHIRILEWSEISNVMMHLKQE
jgi:hypothetical protein